MKKSFFNDTATTEIYTLSLHDALPIWTTTCMKNAPVGNVERVLRSEEHTSELQSPTHISYAVFCLKKSFFNDTATTEIYTLSLHDALPISSLYSPFPATRPPYPVFGHSPGRGLRLQPLWRLRKSEAVPWLPGPGASLVSTFWWPRDHSGKTGWRHVPTYYLGKGWTGGGQEIGRAHV